MGDRKKARKITRNKRHFIFPVSSAAAVREMLKKKHPVEVDTKMYGSNVTYEDGETVVAIEIRTMIKFILFLALGAGLAWTFLPSDVAAMIIPF